jgi:tetratricopeptide (TPR) repeat protein
MTDCSRMKAARRMRTDAMGRETGIPLLSLVSNPHPMIGARVGHIRITGVLGQGGMGEVYRGIDERLDRPVALKAIRAERRLSADARGRFLREARLLSAVEHPGICRIHEYIEAEDGDYLVLELVEGVTLERAIAAGMSRARKLRAAIEIADALAAAHRKGIVHRDLKPENVMITKDGSVKVLDFGVARQNVEDESPAVQDDPTTIETAETLIFAVDGLSPVPSDSAPVTAHGIAIGTPAFMSPEQAMGRIATPASDMYAFGLVLQTLFTEIEPHPLDIYASELMLRAASGISDPVVGQPRDVTTLIERLKSKAPADRPTAVEALSVLQRIVEKPRRRMRQAALAVVLVLLAAFVVKYVFDVTTARREAERRRRQAEELVSFMVGDLRSKLEGVGRLDVLDGAASRALAYFASLSPDELRGEDLHKNALALAQLGEVRMNEGKLDEAVKMFGQSLRFANAAVERDPKKEEWQLALSNAHFWAGEASRQKGDRPATLKHFGSYLRISQELAGAHPGAAKYAAEVSYGHGNVGAAYEAAGQLEDALSEYRIAVDLDRRRLLSDPQNEKWQTDLAISLNRLGVALQMHGQLPAAGDVFAEELALRRKLVAAAPADTRRVARLAVSLAYNGVLHEMLGDKTTALASFQEELALATTLTELDPSNLSTRRNRAAAESRVADLAALPQALDLSAHAVSEMREILRSDPRPAWRSDLASALEQQAALRMTAGDRRHAASIAGEALAIIEPVALAEPQNPHTARVLCEVLLTAADVDPANAEKHRSRVAEIASAQRTRDPHFEALRERALAALRRTAR